MGKRVINGFALRAIRELKAATDPAFRGSQFATACLMSHAHLINIEKERKSPPIEVVERIATQLGVPVEAISYEIQIPDKAAA